MRVLCGSKKWGKTQMLRARRQPMRRVCSLPKMKPVPCASWGGGRVEKERFLHVFLCMCVEEST